jgi:hypothetical protein
MRSQRLLLDLGAPGVRVLDLIERQKHLARGEQRPVVVAPPHPGDEALDPSVDLDRIRHTSMLRLPACSLAKISTSAFVDPPVPVLRYDTGLGDGCLSPRQEGSRV